MELSEMLKREDFFSLFFSTVERYYKEAFNKNITFTFAEKRKHCNMVIKPRLSAATSVHMSSRAREFFYSEWNIRNSFVKNCIAKIYVFIITRTGKYFSQFYFTMMPFNALNNDIVIAPNNRSIRIFDYGDKTVGCIIKSGFTNKFFNNQLEFRKRYEYDFLVPLIAYGEDWFREPIMFGHPLARTTNDVLYHKGITDAISSICLLAKDTYEEISIQEYVYPLINKAHILVSQAVGKKGICTLDDTKNILKKISDLFVSATILIPTCISHGDFQTGNIWVNENGKTIIYDWETVDRRSVWYDISVLQYSLRRNAGWKALSSDPTPYKVLMADRRKQYTLEEFALIKGVVLLEDILFYLEDMLELPDKWGGDLYDEYIAKIIDFNF